MNWFGVGRTYVQNVFHGGSDSEEEGGSGGAEQQGKGASEAVAADQARARATSSLATPNAECDKDTGVCVRARARGCR